MEPTETERLVEKIFVTFLSWNTEWKIIKDNESFVLGAWPWPFVTVPWSWHLVPWPYLERDCDRDSDRDWIFFFILLHFNRLVFVFENSVSVFKTDFFPFRSVWFRFIFVFSIPGFRYRPQQKEKKKIFLRASTSNWKFKNVKYAV